MVDRPPAEVIRLFVRQVVTVTRVQHAVRIDGAGAHAEHLTGGPLAVTVYVVQAGAALVVSRHHHPHGQPHPLVVVGHVGQEFAGSRHHRVTHRRLPAMEHLPVILNRLIAMVLPLPTLPSLLATPLQHQATATIHGVAVSTQPSRPMDPTLRMDSLPTPLHQHHTSSHLLPTLPS